MNPNGVFVVERPGLSHFFQQLSSFAGADIRNFMLARPSDSTSHDINLLWLQRSSCSQRAWRIMQPRLQTGCS